MKKLLGLFAVLLASVCNAEQTKTIFNPFSSKLDFITKVDTNTITPGSGVNVVCTNGVCTISTSGQSASTLAVATGTATNFVPISSPTAAVNLSNTDFQASLTGTATAFVQLSTNVARTDRNQSWYAPQTYTSSVTVTNLLAGTTITIDGQLQMRGEAVLSVPNEYNIYVGTKAGNAATALASTIVGNGAGENSGASATGLTAVGYRACRGAAAGDGVGGSTTCIGYEAGLALAGANRSLFVGTRAGRKVTTGSDNICLGDVACDETTTGSANINIGNFSRPLAAGDSHTTLVGDNVTSTGSGNTCIGKESCSANGDNNSALGRNALITSGASKAVAIGYGATAPASNTMKLGGEGADSVLVLMSSMTASSATITNARITGLTAGRCVETGAGGLLTAAGAACGTGSGGGDFKVSLSTGLLAGTTIPAGFELIGTTLTFSSATLASARISGLAASQCVQTGAGGLLTVTGSACGSAAPPADFKVSLSTGLLAGTTVPAGFELIGTTISFSSATFTKINSSTITMTGNGLSVDVSTGDIRVSNIRTYSMTRELPTTVGDSVHIGTFTFTNGGGILEVFITVPSGSFSVAKRYIIPVQYQQGPNGSWALVNPIASTDDFVDLRDFELDINVTDTAAALRIRRNLGTNAGTAFITIFHQGVTTDTFTPLKHTATVTRPTVATFSTPLAIVGNRLGVNNIGPLTTLHAGSIPGTADGAVVLASTGIAGGEAAGLTISNSANNTSGNAACLQMIPRGAQDTTTSRMCSVVPTGTSPSTDIYWKLYSSALLEQMRLKSTGELGIGTSAPTQKLEVNGGVLAKSSFTVTGSTWAYLISASTATTAPAINISSTVHINAQDVALTTATSCGTGPTLTGSDVAFTVTAGAGATGCTITFARPYTKVPSCVVTQQTGSVANAFSYTVSATAVTVTKTGLGGELLNGICIGRD